MARKDGLKPVTNPIPRTCGIGQIVRPKKRVIRDKVSASGRRLFRPWQKKAFEELQDKSLGLLISPTGSGKSTVQKALAYALAKRGRKVIVAVPETTIGGSFRRDFRFELPDGSPLDWEIDQNHLCNGHKSGVKKLGALKKFIRNAPGKLFADRVLVCTHQALVRVHEQLTRGSYRNDPWKGTHLFIDEAQHSNTDEGVDQKGIELNNKLGSLVKHYVTKQSGTLLLTTACMFRNDSANIVPAEYFDEFYIYEQHVDEYLASIKDFESLIFKFSLESSYEAGFQEVVNEDPTRKTLVYLPPVKPKQELGVKEATLEALMGVLGRRHATDVLSSRDGVEGIDFTETHVRRVGGVRRELYSLDLVHDQDRKRRCSRFYEERERYEVDKAEAEKLPETERHVEPLFEPHYIFAQNLFREGADWPAAQYSVVCQPRGSVPMLVQMIGRLLRENKGKKTVTFHIMALQNSVRSNPDSFLEYIRTVSTVAALGWYFGSTSTKKGRKEEALSSLVENITEGFFSDAFSEAETDADVIKQAATSTCEEVLEAGGEGSEEEAKELKKKLVRELLSYIKGPYKELCLQMKALSGEKPVLTAEEEQDPYLNSIRRAQTNPMTAASFKALREQYTQGPETNEQYSLESYSLKRFIHFQKKGLYVDPRTVPGMVELFGSKEALDRRCLENGL